MDQISAAASRNLPDVSDFVETLRALDESGPPEARGLFDPEAEVIVSRAPGRLDVMGGIADYSGSLVLQLPIREAACVALQADPSRRLRIVSLSENFAPALSFEILLSEFEEAGAPVEYETARSRFHDPARHWASYVAGAFLVLMRERGIRFQQGARILISSLVPRGKGVSSSAALEVAVMQAVTARFEIQTSARETALLCQKVENLVAGAPCGVMDQMTAACGESNRLLTLLCQPAELLEATDIPTGIAFWGLDSGVRHAVTGADYASVRVGAFMGYRIMADIAGLKVLDPSPGDPVEIDDPCWRGYLANVTPSEFERIYAPQLPERIAGEDFLSRYRGTTDPVTRIAPDRWYAVRAPTAHPVYEHHRVRHFAELLAGAAGERRLRTLGELMYQSHASYSACGLGSEGTDLLVELVRTAGPTQGLYGAKITGGGSGGTVAVLGRTDAGTAVESIAEAYARETGYHPHIFSGSSPGGASFGWLRLTGVKE